jgi:hypothetical protein
MSDPRQLSTVPEPIWRSAVLVTGFIGLLAVLGVKGIPSTDPASHKDISARFLSPEQKFVATLLPIPVITDDRGQTHVALAEPSLAEAIADVSIALNRPELSVENVSTETPDVSPVQSTPVQVATADPSDLDVGSAGKAANVIEASRSSEVADECPVMDVCVDRYLWTLYERTPKEDAIKEPERRNVTVKRRGKMVTVTRTFTKLVDEDFGWKDPKAAERVGMSMMDYVIGGMDRSFKLKLFYLLHAAEAADLSPGITSAFRDDYRQSIASGLKAASNKSYHGGSSRGGYGHGLAADIVSRQGGTRDERWASSEKFWKWVDAHGKDFGIGRPYLGRDPPHVAPIDGQEYAAHKGSSKHAGSTVRKAKSVVMRHDTSPVKRAKTAAALKMRAS